MNKEKDINILLTLLIILSILSFIRTLFYILFDNDLVDIDRKVGFDIEKVMEGVLLIFAILRLYICSIILAKRGLHNDVMTYIMFYLIFTAFLRFYYDYLYFNYPKSETLHHIDNFQDVNAILIYFCSAYILKHILF